MTPFDVAAGYSVFANGGYKVTPSIISRIESYDGTVAFQNPPNIICGELNCLEESSESISPSNDKAADIADPTEYATSNTENTIKEVQAAPIYAPRVLDEDIAYLMDSMLRDVVQRGTATKAKILNRNDLAGKTGTTNGPLDAWFSGYAGGIVTTTWVGFDDNQKLGTREFGGSAALPIWIDYMREALKNKPELRQAQPSGIVSVRINPETGERARTDDPDAIFEVFRINHAPKQSQQSEQSIPDNAIEYSEEIF